MMVSFVLSFFPRDVLDEILKLIESVSEDFPSYSLLPVLPVVDTNVSLSDFLRRISILTFRWTCPIAPSIKLCGMILPMIARATFQCGDEGAPTIITGKLFQGLITLFEKLFARNFNLALFI